MPKWIEELAVLIETRKRRVPADVADEAIDRLMDAGCPICQISYAGCKREGKTYIHAWVGLADDT